MIDKKIKYSDLSNPLKTAVVFAWIIGIFYILSFVVGFVIGLVGVL